MMIHERLKPFQTQVEAEVSRQADARQQQRMAGLRRKNSHRD